LLKHTTAVSCVLTSAHFLVCLFDPFGYWDSEAGTRKAAIGAAAVTPGSMTSLLSIAPNFTGNSTRMGSDFSRRRFTERFGRHRLPYIWISGRAAMG
uniref:Major facilitator superfamily (MFS) profile domain-containing protein n=1 Tax=Parascaris univalens TaxID=6257 RepID=A0A915BX85_PARUN